MTARPKQNKSNGTATTEALAKDERKSSSKVSSGNSKNTQSKRKPREKIFIERNSILTDLADNEHIAAIRNLLMSFYITWVLYIMLGNYLRKSELSVPGLSFLANGYEGAALAAPLWFAMFISTIVFFGGFKAWASIRARKRSIILDSFALACAVSYVTTMLVFPLYLVLKWDMGIMWKGGLAGEQMRLTMKVLAFLSSKTPDCLKTTNDSGKKKQTPMLSPSLGHFVYFLFAPTIIYSDTYPRKKHIRWSFVALCLAQIFGCIHAGAVVLENTLVASTRDFGSKVPITLINFLYACLYNAFPSFMILVLSTYGLFHCLQNVVGEMLRFADRQFYLDWWTQGSTAAYFRNAHILPQDWLHFYVYRPIKDATNSRLYAQVGTFILSGIVHELLFVAMFGFLYPVTFVAFVLVSGTATYFDRNPQKTAIGNLMFLLTYPFSVSLLEVSLAVEFFSRENCPRTLDSTLDFFVPRSWFCNQTNLHTTNSSDWSLI